MNNKIKKYNIYTWVMHIGSIGIGIGTCDHITDGLISLHWLRVPERILYKPAVVAYKVLRGDAPRYYRSADPCRRLVWSTNTPFYPSGQLPRGTTRQTVNSRQPSLCVCGLRLHTSGIHYQLTSLRQIHFFPPSVDC